MRWVPCLFLGLVSGCGGGAATPALDGGASGLTACAPERPGVVAPCMAFRQGGQPITWDRPVTGGSSAEAASVHVTLIGTWGTPGGGDTEATVIVQMDLDATALRTVGALPVAVGGTATFQFTPTEGYFDPVQTPPATYVASPTSGALVQRIWVGITCFCSPVAPGSQVFNGTASVVTDAAGRSRLHVSVAETGSLTMSVYGEARESENAFELLVDLPPG